MIHPIDKVYITQKFGERPEVYRTFGLKGHNGIDYRTRFIDSPLAHRYVVAPDGGKIIEVGNQGSKGYGMFIRIQHKGTSQSVLGHLSKQYVKVGQVVKSGDTMGLTGNTGFSSGPHLHWGFRPNKWKQNNGFAGYIDQLSLIK